jgi:hypothetical protein
VGRFEDGRIRLDPVGHGPAAYERRVHVRQLDHQISIGYYYLDEARRVQRPTWKGAILVSWKLLWPAKQIRLALRRHRAERLLRQLESESMAA